MEKVKVMIKGTAPLLQHRYPMEEHPEEKSKKVKKIYPAQDECEKSLYMDDKLKIYQPAEHIYSCIIMAGKNFLYDKRKMYASVLKGMILVTPSAIYHKDQNWVIDRRPVVINRARIVRARPRFDNWELEFEIEYDEEVISEFKLKEIVDFAGNRVGLGDFRPLFGRFIVTEFKKA